MKRAFRFLPLVFVLSACEEARETESAPRSGEATDRAAVERPLKRPPAAPRFPALSAKVATEHLVIESDMDPGALAFHAKVFQAFVDHLSEHYVAVNLEKPLKIVMIKRKVDYREYCKERFGGYGANSYGITRPRNTVVFHREGGIGTATHLLVGLLLQNAVHHYLPTWIIKGFSLYFEKFIGYLDAEDKLHISFGYFSPWRFKRTKEDIAGLTIKKDILRNRHASGVRSFMLFLNKRGVLKDLLKSYEDAQFGTDQIALESLLSVDLAEIEKDWKEWVTNQPLDDNVKLVPFAFVHTERDWNEWLGQRKDTLHWDEDENMYLVAVGGTKLRLSCRDEEGNAMPCRVHLFDKKGKAHHPPALPFWKGGGFVCGGTAALTLPAGRYRYEIERGPEWSLAKGEIEVADEAVEVKVILKRIADLKKEGWYAGDLHVHRAPGELPLHMQAEDLTVASVQTWWNKRNLLANADFPASVRELEGQNRFYSILGGEDERGGGALLFHRMPKVIDITKAEREWPSSVKFLREAKRIGGTVEIEKPFWWDTPLWLSTGKIDSIGIAQNHMQRRGVLGTEAWGRPRDRERYPGVHGNGLYTQDLYYKILNCGFRMPPSAGSASGVLANPVGYNRVYVQAERPTWDGWWKAFALGRSFVTNGPLLRVTANGKHPQVMRATEWPMTLKIEGKIDSRDPIKKIELVQNGNVSEINLPTTITVEKVGWFLVRAIADVDETFRFASTAPWYVENSSTSEKAKPDHESALFFLKWAQERKAMVETALKDEKKRREVVAEHEKAIAFWEKLVTKAASP